MTQFFDVMGNRGRHNIQILADGTHTGRFAGVENPDGAGFATGSQAEKDFQSVGIRQCLKNLGIFFNFDILTCSAYIEL